jgi:hypothetical protein
LEEERKFLARFAKAAGAGELLNIRALKITYEEEIGRPTSESTIYNLLARRKWRKLMPRPFHPERDEKAQEAYKKGFCQAVKKARRIAAARYMSASSSFSLNTVGARKTHCARIPGICSDQRQLAWGAPFCCRLVPRPPGATQVTGADLSPN